MKTLGLLGGFFYEDTEYYRWEIIEAVYRRTHVVPPLLVQHADYDCIHALHDCGRLFDLENYYITAAEALQEQGAEGLILCSDILHKIVPALQAAVDLPVIDFDRCFTSEAFQDYASVFALLDEQHTMEDQYYRCQFYRRFGYSRISYLTQHDIAAYVQENPLVKSSSQSAVITYKFGTVLGERAPGASSSSKQSFSYGQTPGAPQGYEQLLESLVYDDSVHIVDLCFNHIGEAVDFIITGIRDGSVDV